MVTLVSKDVEFSFDPFEKFVGRRLHTRTPTQKLKIGFPKISSQDIGSGLVSLKMIFGALQFELFRFKIHSLGSKILKFPEFNLRMLNQESTDRNRSCQSSDNLFFEPKKFENLNFSRQRRIFTVFDVNLYNSYSAPTQVNSHKAILSPPAILTVDGNIATYA